MPSLVWGRAPQEAFEEPYGYAVQDQFVREACGLFRWLHLLLDSDRHRYTGSDHSPRKAVWLLAMDALDSLRDCLQALTWKEHRIAGRLFRDVVETMDLAAFFNSEIPSSEGFLAKWYADDIVPHRVYRGYIRRTHGPAESGWFAKHYAALSRFTHRSYRAILEGYSQGAEDRMVHDRTGGKYGNGEPASKFLVLQQTIASHYAVLANITLEYTSELPELRLVTRMEIREAYVASLESETVPRRFIPRRLLAQRLTVRSLEEGHGDTRLPTSGARGRSPSCHGVCRGKRRATSAPPHSRTARDSAVVSAGWRTRAGAYVGS